MFFKRKVFRQSYVHVSLCLMFLFSGSIVGCLQEENPSPLEKKLQVLILGPADWPQEGTADNASSDQLVKKALLENQVEKEKQADLIELIQFRQE